MNISFECLGFGTTAVFITKDNRQYHIGDLFLRCSEPSMNYYGCYERYLMPNEIPSLEQIKEEYDKQLNEKGVSINREIVYAG